MKADEQKIARKMRKDGFSIKTIAKELDVSKGSVSRWVNDIILSNLQLQSLRNNSYTTQAIEKRRISRLTKENRRRQIIVDQAKLNIKNDISEEILFFIGVSLYWAEGSKTRRNIVHFSNADPRLIRIMMLFFKRICKVPNLKFRGHVHLHPHLNRKVAESYWSEVSNIPLDQFFKTSQPKNKASQNKKDSLPFGTFNIYVCNTELFLKIKGWMEGIADQLK
jgi:transposase-like protein